jgi:hypothetical protein
MILYLAIFIFIVLGALRLARLTLKGIRASDDELVAMARFTGTRNPAVSRALCWIAFPILAAVVALPSYWLLHEFYKAYFT